ncbi:methyltransferase domain-containing protein [Thalassospira sp. HF15]|uniref:class I SAM-dependent methyltransferase n=1 Tax=Thalassospira sp. HF15 TaxID=2722755 RepID=UPI00142F4C15|nr:class I SAM-dependent methyltransferase [Thalassospira sp. HF15]NIY75461.1 methyltransferase domain-containing protein [Thalassospira sp. HF15]
MDYQTEINGDGIRGLKPRLIYFIQNFRRNLRPARKLKASNFSTSSLFRTPNAIHAWSPGRGLSEEFIIQYLPKLIFDKTSTNPEGISILDIGCGSGRSVELFKEAGLNGKWHGTDIDHRFVERDSTKFVTSFSQGDILTSEWEQEFDLIYTNSALEHIPFAHDFPNKIGNWLKPGGMQVHIVPAPTSLFLYLWHGWRQYSLRRIEEEFQDSNIEVFPIGGFFTSALQFFFITFWENILRISIREKFKKTYKWLLFRAIRADRHAPIFPVFYVVIATNDPAHTKNNRVS